MLAERITSPSTNQTELTPFRTDSSELFVVSQNVNPLRIRQIRAHALNTRGMGIPNESLKRSESVPARLIDFYTPCFHGLTNPCSSNAFPFTSIQNGGRARPTSDQNGKAPSRFPARTTRNLQGGTRLPTASHLSTQPSEATNVSSPRCDQRQPLASAAPRMRNGVLFNTACLPPPAAKESLFLRSSAGYSS